MVQSHWDYATNALDKQTFPSRHAAICAVKMRIPDTAIAVHVRGEGAWYVYSDRAAAYRDREGGSATDVRAVIMLTRDVEAGK